MFICENNQWALSAPFLETTAGGSVAKRASAYGMPGEEVDGNDVEAVFAEVSKAANRARQGSGPAIIECESYRWEGHWIFTSPGIRQPEEIDRWKRRDPITSWRDKILEKHSATVEQLDSIENDVMAEIAKAVEFAKRSPFPDQSTALEDVYASRSCARYPLLPR